MSMVDSVGLWGYLFCIKPKHLRSSEVGRAKLWGWGMLWGCEGEALALGGRKLLDIEGSSGVRGCSGVEGGKLWGWGGKH